MTNLKQWVLKIHSGTGSIYKKKKGAKSISGTPYNPSVTQCCIRNWDICHLTGLIHVCLLVQNRSLFLRIGIYTKPRNPYRSWTVTWHSYFKFPPPNAAKNVSNYHPPTVETTTSPKKTTPDTKRRNHFGYLTPLLPLYPRALFIPRVRGVKTPKPKFYPSISPPPTALSRHWGYDLRKRK